MRGLITDRTQYNVDRLNILSKKKHTEMTDAEKAEWSGNPYDVAVHMPNEVVNLIPRDSFTTIYTNATLSFTTDTITATTTLSGYASVVYGYVYLGSSEFFENKSVTLSVEEITTTDGMSPALSLYWLNSTGEYIAPAYVEVTESGSYTNRLYNNFGSGSSLLLRVCLSQNSDVTPNAKTCFKGVMLELGDTAHDFVPYYEVFPTPAIKGAYNYFDLNRIERAVKDISNAYGLYLQTKTDWTVADYPTTYDMSRFLSNITTIREMLPNRDSLPTVPTTMNKLTYKQANVIEKILSTVEIDLKQKLYSGELFCGEV